MENTQPKLSVKDQALKSVARGAGIFFIGIMLGRFLGYLIRMVIARLLGPEQYGLISLGISVVEISATLALFGLPTAINRYVPFYWTRGQTDRVRGTIRSSLAISLPAALATGLVLFWLTNQLSLDVFKKPDLIPILKIFAVIVPFYSIMMISSAIFTGFKKMEYIVYTQQFLRYILILAIFVALFLFGFGIDAAIYAYPVGYFFTAVMGLFLAQRLFPFIGKQLESRINFKQILTFSWPLILVSMIWFIIDRVATIMLGYFKSSDIVGIYNAALPLAQLIPAVLQSFTTIFLPIVSSILSTGDFKELRNIYTITTKWVFLFTLPLFIVIFASAKFLIVTLFGAEYVDATPALQILSLGFLFHAAVGPTTMTLNALEKTKLILFNTVVAFVANISLHYFLIPKYGIVGAAIAAAAALLILNVLTLIEIFVLYRIMPFNKNYFKILTVGVLSTTGLYLVANYLLSGLSILTFFLLMTAFALCYLIFILFARIIEPEDLVVLREVKKKFGINIKLPEFVKSRIQ